MSNDKNIVLTPMMKQFLDLKAKHPDAVPMPSWPLKSWASP